MRYNPSDSSYKTNTYFKLLEALPMPGCAICRFTDAALRQYVDDLFSEHLWVMERREEMRNARGFCSAHAPLIDDYGRILGIAVLHHDILGSALRDIDAATQTLFGQQRVVAAVANAVKPWEECIFCRYSHEQERFALRTLLAEWRDEKMRPAFAQSSGLCLPHFHVALEMREFPQRDLVDLIYAEISRLKQLDSDLEEFIRKSNLAYAHETMQQEADSPRRALKMASGKVTSGDSRLVRKRMR